MRFLHHNPSFDSGIVSLLLERVEEKKVIYKLLCLLQSALKVRGILDSMRLIESLFAFILFLPIPIISSLIVRYVSRLTGASGFYLRSLYFRQKARYIGRNVLIGQNVMVSKMSDLRLDDFAYLDRDVIIMCKASVGKRCHLAVGCFVSGGGELVIEDYASLGMKSVVLTSSDSAAKGYRASGPMVPMLDRRVISRKNIFRKDSFTGPLTLIFPGVVMNVGSVLAAGSVLRRTTKEWGVYLGNPAKRVSWRDKI